jgi:putative ABC transport system permease protein
MGRARRGDAMPLVVKLACRNLLQDRLRFVATVVGIVFSIVLVTVQLGLYLGFEQTVTTMIRHAHADLWVVPRGTKCFEDPSLLDERERAAVLAVGGVADAVPLLIGFAEWTVAGGGTTPVFVVGSTLGTGGLHPWNIVGGSIGALAPAHAVAADRTYFDRLGVAGLGDTVEIRGEKARIAVVTDGIRSFTTTPYIFTTLDRARAYIGSPPGRVSYFLVHLAPGADADTVRQQLAAKLSNAEILTPAQFSARSRSFWLFGTGAGAALIAGALLGVIVGTVIVAQTLYSSTKDHLDEFATLRAIGAAARYVNKVILCQAVVSAVIGFLFAACISAIVVEVTKDSALPILMTPELTLGLFVLTVSMCIISAFAAIVQVIRIDPIRVFTS